LLAQVEQDEREEALKQQLAVFLEEQEVEHLLSEQKHQLEREERESILRQLLADVLDDKEIEELLSQSSRDEREEALEQWLAKALGEQEVEDLLSEQRRQQEREEREAMLQQRLGGFLGEQEVEELLSHSEQDEREGVLKLRLAGFLGEQEVEDLLWDWTWKDLDAPVITRALPDDTARLRFGRVLRALLDEQFSIVSWRDIVEGVQAVGLAQDDVREVVRDVRLRLKRFLPGNSATATRVFCPESVERSLSNRVASQGGIQFLNIPPDEKSALLSEVREEVGPYEQDIVLIARDPSIRPYLRELIEWEFPRTMVIAKEELLPPYDVATHD
jgi:type III secretory pathway component EscV